MGKSPPSRLGESPSLSTLPACEDCVGASSLEDDGSGAGMVTGFSSPMTSEVGVVPSFVFGLPVANIAEISSMTFFASRTPAIISLIPERVEAAALLCGSPVVSVAGLEPLGMGDPGESSV